MKVDLRLRGLDGVLDTLKKLPPEIVAKRGGPVLQSLRKGARVILKEARANLDRATANHPTFSTGLGRKSLGIARSRMPGGVRGEAVRIRVRRLLYPGNKKRRGRKMATGDALWMLEYGTAKQPAEPWLRPAFDAKAEEAIATTVDDLKRRVDDIVRKQLAQNRK